MLLIDIKRLARSYALWALFASPLILAGTLPFLYGVPYFKDSNETFHSFLHGWNLVHGNALQYSFLTVHGLAEESCPYTHNPNFPRYLHALLIALGILDIRIHVLLLSFACALLTVVFIRKSFDAPSAALLVLFTLLDWAGSQYLGNTYRAFSFPLFWGAIFGMRNKTSAAFAFFVLFQFEFAFAAFAATTALLYHRRRPEILYAIGGAAVSVLLFATQVYTFLGFEDMLVDIASTAGRRTGGITLPQHYSKILVIILLIGVIRAIYRVRGPVSPEKDMSALYLAMLGGFVASSLLFSGYVNDAYMVHGLPFITMFISVGFTVLALWLRRWVALFAFPLVLNSHGNLRDFPPLSAEYITAVRQHAELAYTDGPIYGAGFAANPQIATNPDSFLYLCLRRPWFGLTCETKSLAGATLLSAGNDFVLARIPGGEKPTLGPCKYR